LSGQTIDALARNYPSSIGSIRYRTISDSHFSWDRPEILTSTYHASNLIQAHIHDDDLQHSYINHFVREDIQKTNYSLFHTLDRKPRGFCPSEKMFSILSSYVLDQEGYNYCVIGGECFGSTPHGKGNKGQIFFNRSNNLLLVPTTNEVDPSDFAKHHTGESFVNDVIRYAKDNGVQRLLLACDVDFFLEDVEVGFERLKWIYLKALEKANDVRFVNTSALVYSAFSSEYSPLVNLEDFYQSIGIQDPYRFTSTWVTAAGNLDFVDGKRSYDFKLFLEEWERKRKAGANWEILQRARSMWLDNISSTVLYDNRERWRNFLPAHYDENLTKSWNLLHEA